MSRPRSEGVLDRAVGIGPDDQRCEGVVFCAAACAGWCYQVGGVLTQTAVHSSVSEGLTYQCGMVDA